MTHIDVNNEPNLISDFIYPLLQIFVIINVNNL